MGAFSIWHWLIVLVVVLVLFGGGGKISRLMGDFGKGLKSFKKGMKEEDGEADDKGDDADKKKIETESQDTVAARETEKDKAAGS
jgi:sec-independent protein translocase protein TatA